MEKHLNEQAIKKEVRNRYAELITSDGLNSCCSDSSCCTSSESMKGTLVKSAGYADEELKSLPNDAVENAYGCGNPLAFSEVEEGQTVLDIGSGAGIDCFLASQKVGPRGRIIGIDMTQEMIDKARQNVNKAGYTNVEFRLGEAEAMPVDDACVDWVISNCVINLSPDKPKVFAEIARVLKTGGRFSISDIVLGADLPDSVALNMHAWTGCVAGAIRETDYVEGLVNAGLSEVSVSSRIPYDDSVIRGFIDKYVQLPMTQVEQVASDLSGKIWSAKIVGRK